MLTSKEKAAAGFMVGQWVQSAVDTESVPVLLVCLGNNDPDQVRIWYSQNIPQEKILLLLAKIAEDLGRTGGMRTTG